MEKDSPGGGYTSVTREAGKDVLAFSEGSMQSGEIKKR